MSTAPLTEERLRTWLDTNQVQRERLSIAVLSLDRRYTDVKPRRPKGGPDGSRDIEAILDGDVTVWGGVGFRKSANDSSEDKRWVAQKFEADLVAAISTNPELHGFVFFTNVDLTPTEVAALEKSAREKGLSHVDMYYRERMRIALDSPAGLAFRFQYLSIPLSEAEQATFFATFGSQLEELIVRQFSAVDEKLARIEFCRIATSHSQRWVWSWILTGPTQQMNWATFGYVRAYWIYANAIRIPSCVLVPGMRTRYIIRGKRPAN